MSAARLSSAACWLPMPATSTSRPAFSRRGAVRLHAEPRAIAAPPRGPCIDTVDLARPGSGCRSTAADPPVPAPGFRRNCAWASSFAARIVRGSTVDAARSRRPAFLVIGVSHLAQPRQAVSATAPSGPVYVASSTAARCAAHRSTASACAATARARGPRRASSVGSSDSAPDRPTERSRPRPLEATTSSPARAPSRVPGAGWPASRRDARGPVEIVRRTSRLAAGRARMISMRRHRRARQCEAAGKEDELARTHRTFLGLILSSRDDRRGRLCASRVGTAPRRRVDPRHGACSEASDSVRAKGTATLSPSIPCRRGRRSRWMPRRSSASWS